MHTCLPIPRERFNDLESRLWQYFKKSLHLWRLQTKKKKQKKIDIHSATSAGNLRISMSWNFLSAVSFTDLLLRWYHLLQVFDHQVLRHRLVSRSLSLGPPLIEGVCVVPHTEKPSSWRRSWEVCWGRSEERKLIKFASLATRQRLQLCTDPHFTFFDRLPMATSRFSVREVFNGDE